MSSTPWVPDAPGVLELPSGRSVRGRGLRVGIPPGPVPNFGVYLLGKEPADIRWESRWVRWRDFWLPANRDAFADVIREALQRCGSERVEIACGGGYGRTGTALACLVAEDGYPSSEAVNYVRQHYSRRAVETPWQKKFVLQFHA